MSDDSPPPTPTPSPENRPTHEAVRKQLAAILASSEFARKPTLVKFLQFVVDASLAGRSHQIKGFTIATQVLGRKETFDAVKDPTVRILAGKLRAALDHYYLHLGRCDSVRIEIPRGTYVPVFRDRSTEEAMVGSSVSGPGASRTAPTNSPGIAVMPLRSLSGDPEVEYFAEGLTDDLVTELVRYQDFPVVPCHSMAKVRGRRNSACELGRELKVRFLLEGSVRKEGCCIKVAVGMIDTANEIQVWGEQYQRELSQGGLIELQEEIAASIAARLSDSYGVISQKLSTELREFTPGASARHEAFLRVREYAFVLTREAFARAMEVLEDARERDPHSGMVWAMLANLCADDNTLWAGSLGISMAKALTHARRGAFLDPLSQYARAILAYLHLLVGDREGCLKEAQAAVELNPNSHMMTAFLGWIFSLSGEWERGQPLMEKGMAPNLHYPRWLHLAPCLHLYAKGRYELAYRQARQFQLPEFFWDPLLRAAALGQLDRPAEARAALDDLLQLRPDFPSCARQRLGFFVKAEDHIEGILDGLKKAGLEI